jgi:hypothetical protein
VKKLSGAEPVVVEPSSAPTSPQESAVKKPSAADSEPSEPVVEPSSGVKPFAGVEPVAGVKPFAGVKPATCMLSHGDVFVLGPETNRVMQHGVPPTAAPTQPRISLVFRHINVEMTRTAMLLKVDNARTQKASRQRAKKRTRDAAAVTMDNLPSSQRARAQVREQSFVVSVSDFP